MKELVGLDPTTWLQHLGVPPTGPVTMLPTDLTGTILMEADQVLRIGGHRPWLVQRQRRPQPSSYGSERTCSSACASRKM